VYNEQVFAKVLALSCFHSHTHARVHTHTHKHKHTQDDNWPLLTVSKGFFETLAANIKAAVEQGKATGAATAELDVSQMEGAGWGDDDLDLGGADGARAVSLLVCVCVCACLCVLSLPIVINVLLQGCMSACWDGDSLQWSPQPTQACVNFEVWAHG